MNKLQSLLTEQISNLNSVFVFPTDIAASRWADWCIENTGKKAVAMERFMAWDKFKGERIRGKAKDLKSIPALMRKIFVTCLLEKNSQELFFKSLVSPKYSKESNSFADWISSILPSLKMWKSLRTAQNKGVAVHWETQGTVNNEESENLKNFYEDYKSHEFTDEEDEDLNLLYEKYSEFLEKNKLFDPAWVTPDFSADGREYFLVYPETLEDWEQYKNQLSKAKSVHILAVPENEGCYDSYFFENSSVELKDAALYLREKHDKDKIEWSEMAVNVPNLDDYGSYLDRVLSLYSIPHNIRYSRPLSTYGAGALFSQILDCVQNSFSYESVKNLLLNEDLPWANKTTIENLLLFGRMNNCICTPGELNFEEGKLKTIWNEAFENPKDDRGENLNKDELIKNLRDNLQKILPEIVNAESFSKIRDAYEEFRDNFFDMSAFTTMKLSDNVLSRCITSLNELIELEEEYNDYKVSSPYAFFVSHLSKVQYLSQGETRNVQVFPYRTAAAAPFKIHIVVDSTQDSLSIADSFKPLDFLNDNKRRLFLKMGEADSSLGFSDSDPSYDFVKMYQHSGTENTYFTASRHAYNGKYGFAYGKMLKTTDKIPSRADTYAEEKAVFTTSGLKSVPEVYSKQKNGLSDWIESQKFAEEDSGLFEKNEKLSDLIRTRLHYTEKNKKIEVTQSTLKQYFACPRKWLFKEILNLAPLDKEAELIDEYIIGKVNHKVFENFFTKLKNEKDTNRRKLCVSDEDNSRLTDTNRKLLVCAINEAIDSSEKASKSAFKDYYEKYNSEKQKVSTTTIKIIASQYKIEDENKAEENANFRMLEKSIAHLCKIFNGYTVYALEKKFQALPEEAFAGEKSDFWDGYYFSGIVDCILKSPAQDTEEFAVIDFKNTNSSIPKNRRVKEKEEGKKEQVIDFQLPLYLYLTENCSDKTERLNVKTAIFYSINGAKETLFLGNPPNGAYKNQYIPTDEDVKKAKDEMKKRAKQFYDEVTAENFSVDCVNQGRMVCTSKGQFDNCIDYQALCRRYFTVSGEGK